MVNNIRPTALFYLTPRVAGQKLGGVDDEAASKPLPPKDSALPDPARCRTNLSITNSLFYCLVPGGDACECAEEFHDVTYCFHPDAPKFYCRVR